MARQPRGPLLWTRCWERDFAGKLQCDGYSAYPAFAKDKRCKPLWLLGPRAAGIFRGARNKRPKWRAGS